MKRIMKRNIIGKAISNYIYDSPLPININYWYNIGSLLGIILLSQILTGFFLACYYIGDITLAFKSIQYIMREVNGGYIIRNLHANGAAFFFLLVYLHITRALWYGSYTRRRISAWYSGIIIFILLILTAFIGYSLILSQLSFWAIKVITNLLTVIPYVGNDIIEWIYGGYNIGNATITRFYAIHYILPIIITAVVLIHLITLHSKGGTNPLSINSIRNLTTINFHPYFTIKDLLGIFLLFFILIYIISFKPDFLNHADYYTPANPLITPPHIQPEVYFLYFYMGLRSIPNKVLGVITLLSLILLLFLLPYLHKGLISTAFFRPLIRPFLLLFFLNFIFGTYLGSVEVEEPFIFLSKVSLIYYFFFFLLLLPLISFLESILFSYSQEQFKVGIREGEYIRI
jgi:ubiquinol-cytochrome c reductase cytochrome b subunit